MPIQKMTIKSEQIECFVVDLILRNTSFTELYLFIPDTGIVPFCGFMLNWEKIAILVHLKKLDHICIYSALQAAC